MDRERNCETERERVMLGKSDGRTDSMRDTDISPVSFSFSLVCTVVYFREREREKDEMTVVVSVFE